jgi:mycothiol S-conjugate amidase
MDRPEVRADLPAIRRRELEAAARAIGYDEIVWLGYRDSGMPGTPANEHPDSFARAPLAEAVGRLVAVLRRNRPQVVLTYPEDQSGYPHPDHLRVHEVTMAAVAAAADSTAWPEAGEPWQVAKVYYSVWSPDRLRALHEKFLELGQPSPFDDARLARAAASPVSVTARIDVGAYEERRRAALMSHATQIDPNSPFWFGLPPEAVRDAFPYEDWQLALGVAAPGPSGLEDDLFAGVFASGERSPGEGESRESSVTRVAEGPSRAAEL